MKKLIKEQIDINAALTNKCFSKEKYPWFTMDDDKQPKKTNSGKLVITGKNSKNQTVFFYEMESGKDFGIYKNIDTGNFKKWNCENVQSKEIVDKKTEDDTKNKIDDKKEVNLQTNKDIDDIKSGLTNAGWTTVRPDITSAEYDMGMDIRNISSGRFAHLYQQMKDAGIPTVVYPIKRDSTLDTFKQIDDPEEFKKMSEKGILDKKECKKWIKGLYNARQNNTPFTSTQLLAAKTKVFACYKQNIKFSQGAFGLGDELRELIGDIGKYGIGDFVRGSGAKINETMKHNIKSIVKENLIISANKKQKKLLSENKIIVSRYKLLSEGVKPKNKKEMSRFFDSVIFETAYLHSQNYDKTLIKEGLMDLFGGLFGNASTSIFSYFKEHLAKWFVTKFTPIDPNSWIGNIIITAVGNVPLTELHNLTNCSYVSNLLSKSVAEGAVNKIKNEQGLSGPGYDILRNALIEMAEDSSFGQKIEHKISEYICPKLEGLKGKMEGITGKIKSNALNLGDKAKEMAKKGMEAKQSLVS